MKKVSLKEIKINISTKNCIVYYNVYMEEDKRLTSAETKTCIIDEKLINPIIEVCNNLISASESV